MCITSIVHFILLLQIADSCIKLTVVEVPVERGACWCCNLPARAFIHLFLDLLSGLMLNYSDFSIHGRVCWRINQFRVLSLSGYMCGMIGHCRILILSGCMFRRIRHCRKLSPSGCICRRMSWGRMLSPRSTCARGSVTLCAFVVGVSGIGATFVVDIKGLLMTVVFP